MTWTKLGDEFPDEAASLSDPAFRLHVEALCWSNRRLLDLMVPKDEFRRFASTADGETVIVELTAKGWWQDCDTEWFIGMKFPEWQRDKVQVIARRERESRAQLRRRKHLLDDHSLCLPKSCSLAPLDESRNDDARDVVRDPGRLRDGTVTGDPTPLRSEELQDVPDFIRANDEAMDRLRSVKSS